MQNKELSALLEDRDPLAAQTVLELSGDSGEPASFRIDALLGAGGSSLVYRVTRLSESEGSVQGSLKEFYPCSVGGGSQDGYLNQMAANVTGLPVYAGPTEGTALGNLMVQMLAAGEFPDLAAIRKAVRHSFSIQEVLPC